MRTLLRRVCCRIRYSLLILRSLTAIRSHCFVSVAAQSLRLTVIIKGGGGGRTDEKSKSCMQQLNQRCDDTHTSLQTVLWISKADENGSQCDLSPWNSRSFCSRRSPSPDAGGERGQEARLLARNEEGGGRSAMKGKLEPSRDNEREREGNGVMAALWPVA
ncbi:hypothetical protein B296_00058174 [Ensete ventricosum]|uniref:Uncharacterized protein n=1 Tax=Ensete ventricosum TaxID=4639 RepID=A0A426XB63_ENSVE|nr:hypothetical protein B296_00058174 [Ensete ventricosum]